MSKVQNFLFRCEIRSIFHVIHYVCVHFLVCLCKNSVQASIAVISFETITTAKKDNRIYPSLSIILLEKFLSSAKSLFF
ncbi:MAG: hypothetical protein LBU74_06700 [Methanobacteriaceae archaeon]|nr:hypothetical protein [Candidatus Methanorudis spinitermitis]